MKEKRFIIFSFAVFLIFLFLGKYVQEQALTDTDLIYSTKVERKSNGEEVVFQVQRTEDNAFIIKNQNNGQVARAESSEYLSHTHLRIGLADDEGTLDLRQGLIPWIPAKLTLQRSTVYRQIEGTSSVELAEGRKLSDEDEVDVSDMSYQELSLTDDQIKKIANSFGKWLYDSSYGQNAVIVKGQFNDPASSGGDLVASAVDTEDGTILTRLFGVSDGSLTKSKSGKLGTQAYSGDDFMTELESISISQLGMDLTTNLAADTAPKTAFRLYHLKEEKHANYDKDTEGRSIITNQVPSSEQTAYRHEGYDYLYDQLVDTTRPSLQIILATNGRVYYTQNYGSESYADFSIVTYELAPSDMQEAYQKLLLNMSSSTSKEE